MKRTYKYRIYPTGRQSDYLSRQLEEACDLYNCALQERREAWKISRKSLTYYDQANQLKQLRSEGLLGIVNAQCAQDVLRRVDKAYRGFFSRVKRGIRPGFPRFKTVGRYSSITFPSIGNGCAIRGERLYIQGAGEIKLRLHRPILGRVKSATIKRAGDWWYVCFSVEVDFMRLPPTREAIGLDVGIASFVVMSNAESVANPKFLDRSSALLARRQRKLAKRRRDSKRRSKARTLVARTHAVIRRQRADFQHKLSRRIVNSFGLIAVERLNVRALATGLLARQVHDAAWGQFLTFLSYKAEEAGRDFIKVDPRGTSQTCLCGAKVPKRLSDRWHLCPACGLSEPRDLVSAKLILQRARCVPSGGNVEVVDSCVAREAA